MDACVLYVYGIIDLVLCVCFLSYLSLNVGVGLVAVSQLITFVLFKTHCDKIEKASKWFKQTCSGFDSAVF